MPAADLELGGADDDTAPPVVHPDFADMRERDEGAAVDAHESVLAPLLLEGGQRDSHQVAAVLGVQSGVVPLGLRIADLAAADEPCDAPQLDRDGLVRSVCLGPAGFLAAGENLADGFPKPVLAHWLHDVVGGVEGEGIHCVLVMRGDEDDLGLG